MTGAFVVFVRFEEKLLLLKRGESDGDFPGLWDGIWGIADSPEEVIQRVSDSTGIPVEDLHYECTGPERGIDMGRNLMRLMSQDAILKEFGLTRANYKTISVFSQILTWRMLMDCSRKCMVQLVLSYLLSRPQLARRKELQTKCMHVCMVVVH